MYGLAYVLFEPAGALSLERTLRDSLAPFQRGGPDLFDYDKLVFEDRTADLEATHKAVIELRWSEGGGIQLKRVPDSAHYYTDSDALRDLLKAWGGDAFEGRLCDIEPDIDAFASRFWRWKKRDPRTGRYGQWYNLLGRWDWWDLGGRFNCAILGQRGEHLVVDEGLISSGPSRGRDAVGAIAEALGAEASNLEALMEANVEPVSALLSACQAGKRHAYPSVLVLPAGAVDDTARWIESPSEWVPKRDFLPAAAKAMLGLPDEAKFKAICRAAYRRFESYAAAGVAYHF